MASVVLPVLEAVSRQPDQVQNILTTTLAAVGGNLLANRVERWKELHRWKEEIKTFLGGLRLTLHDRKSVVFPVSEGIDFLGYRVFPTFRRMRRVTVRRFTRRLRHLRDAHRAGRITIHDVSQSIQSWVAHCRHAQSYRLRRAVLSRMTF